MGICLIALCLPRGSGGKTGYRAQVDKRRTFINLAIVKIWRPDDHIVIAVIIDIAGSRNRKAKMGICLIALCLPRGSGGKTGYRAQVDKRRTFIILAIIKRFHPDDHIVIAVIINITGSRNRTAKMGICLTALCLPRRRGGKTGYRSQIDKRRTFIILAKVKIWRPDDHIVIAVIIDIAGSRNRKAKMGICLIALCLPRGSGGKTGYRAQVDKRRTFINLAIAICPRPDDHIVIAVIIDIAGSRNRKAKMGICLIALCLPRGSIRKTRYRAQVDKRRTFIILAIVKIWRPDDHIVIAVIIDIAGSRNRKAKMGICLIALCLPGNAAEQGIDGQRIGRSTGINMDGKF